VKFKLDENLSLRAAAPLSDAGHDVATVAGQGMCGAEDRGLIEVCRQEERGLISLDAEFANPFRYPPSEFAGIVVIRVPRQVTVGRLTAAMRLVAAEAGRSPLAGRLWIAQPGCLRVYQGEQDPLGD
jgi:predicted nuclease of predicted toxin-antitoxin system